MESAVLRFCRKPHSLDAGLTPDQESELASLKIREPDEGWYRRHLNALTRVAGVGATMEDFHIAVELIDAVCGLGMSGRMTRKTHYLMSCLAEVGRFDGDLHIAPHKRDNTGVHTLHCLLLNVEMFRRAGLLSPETQSNKVIRLRLLTSLGLLRHDNGEFFSEPSSVAQRSRASQDAEGSGEGSGSAKVNLEYVCAHLALKLVERIAIAAEQHDLVPATKLLHATGLIRESALKARGDEGDVAALEREISSQIKHLGVLVEELPALPARETVLLQHEMQLIRLIDSPEDFLDEFNGELTEAERDYFMWFHAYCKAIDSMQGNRFYKSNSETGGREKLHLFYGHEVEPPLGTYTEWKKAGFGAPSAIPLHLSESKKVLDGIRFSEKHLGKLLHYAERLQTHGEYRQELLLAETVRNNMYLSFIEYLELGPEFIDRQATTSSHEDAALMERVRSGKISGADAREAIDALIKRRVEAHAELEARHQAELGLYSAGTADEGITALCQVESRARLQALYFTALARDYRVAPGEILATSPSLPQALAPAEPVRWKWNDLLVQEELHRRFAIPGYPASL